MYHPFAAGTARHRDAPLSMFPDLFSPLPGLYLRVPVALEAVFAAQWPVNCLLTAGLFVWVRLKEKVIPGSSD